MSGGGLRRWIFASLRFAGLAAVVMTVGWAGWQLMEVLRHGPEKMPSVVKTVPVKDVLVVTDGVLDHPWVISTLALPKGVSLLELNLLKLRERLLASGQVRTATLTLNFPETLAVTISERSPVARIKAAFPDGIQQELLVARDGVVFQGVDFDPAMVETLPWLEGFTLSRQGNGFLPIAGMEPVAELLAKAKLEAEERYRTWEVVSLSRLRSDGEIEVRSQGGMRVVFGTRDDYFRQLARLDLLLDKIAETHPDRMPGEINLALGSQVPVTFAAAPGWADRDERALPSLHPTSMSAPASASPHLQIKLKREL